MNYTAIADQPVSDPRGQSESAWLDALDRLVAKLSDATDCQLHLGSYWCDDRLGQPSSSLVARVRSRRGLPGIESDYWEAALCYRVGNDGLVADACIFPFLDGRPVTSSGLLPEAEELDEFRYWRLDGDHFRDCGWNHPDGPGEWAWIRHPGDEYPQSVRAQLPEIQPKSGRPIVVTLSQLSLPPSPQLPPSARVSLIHANRNRENTNLFPWGNRPLRPGSRHAVPMSDVRVQGSEIQLDLTQFRIRGGWVPGQYHLAFRVQNCRDRNEWSYSSDISAPLKLTIS